MDRPSKKVQSVCNSAQDLKSLYDSFFSISELRSQEEFDRFVKDSLGSLKELEERIQQYFVALTCFQFPDEEFFSEYKCDAKTMYEYYYQKSRKAIPYAWFIHSGLTVPLNFTKKHPVLGILEVHMYSPVAIDAINPYSNTLLTPTMFMKCLDIDFDKSLSYFEQQVITEFNKGQKS